MYNLKNPQIAIIAVLVLLVGGVVPYLALNQSQVDEEILPSSKNDLISIAQESGTVSIFVDEEIYKESFFNFIIDEFSTKYNIDVSVTSGHWSGPSTQLINDKVSGRKGGSYDLLILSDEATARLTEKKLLYSQTSTFIDHSDNSHVFPSQISGVDNDGSVITLWFDTYAFLYNSDEFYKFENVYCYLGLVGEDEDDDDDDDDNDGSGSRDDDDDDDDDNDGSGSGDDDDDDDDEEVEGLLFPNPIKTNAGAALVVNTVLYYSESNYYNGYDASLESEWPELLNFEIDDEPEMEEMDELFGEIEPELVIDSILEAFDEEELLVGYFRYGSILLESLEMDIDDEIEIYIAHEGSMKSNVHSSIPFNANNKAGAILLINEILDEKIQTEIAYSYGSFPSANIAVFDNIFDEAQFWISSDAIISNLMEWPHYQYRINILDMWRVLFEG
tara:strand:- start:1750 stop:3084 length:1335 start_codon:yes stop_codon:yes gene_type:complete